MPCPPSKTFSNPGRIKHVLLYFSTTRTQIPDEPIFIKSPAFSENHGALIERLGRAAGAIPEVMVEACESFLACAGSKVSDPGTKEAYEAYVVVNYLLKVYQESENQTLQNHCLSLLEKMEKLGVRDVRKKLKELDRN